MPVVFVLCVVGSFAITSRVFDIYVMLVFGLIGFVSARAQVQHGAADPWASSSAISWRRT